jgi:hypothetical protein
VASVVTEVGLWDQFEHKLNQSERTAATTCYDSSTTCYPIQPTPWLEVTRWVGFLQGHDLAKAAQLVLPPVSGHADLVCTLVLTTFESLVEEARISVQQEKVNVFDQHRVNSFIRGRSYHRPILVKLREGTYKTYVKLWKQLICFVYNLVYLRKEPRLHHAVTDEQLSSMDRMVQIARITLDFEGRRQHEKTVSNPSCGKSKTTSPEIDDLSRRLRRECLNFCISLLDHSLKGNIYDSVVVGFFAVMGINEERKGFREPENFTHYLSAFIKIAQLLVMQRAVVAADLGEAEFPGELLDEMQDRFMVSSSRSPMHWALKLRTFGRKIRDQITSLGYINWSDDGQRLSYKSLDLDMQALRWFMRDQVELGQCLLEQLLLIQPGEARDRVVPEINLRELRDDPTIKEAGWSFLKDERNNPLPDYQKWLLRRVCNISSVTRRFLTNDDNQQQWETKAVESYLQLREAFLRQLLLLIHMTGGQPARGTELLTLQWRNTTNGLRRNIFVENGLVSFVTAYHKGYSVTGSTKIIHRYTPLEVSELIVYYLCFVQPFCDQIRILAYNIRPTETSLLWPKSNSTGVERPWTSDQLSQILKERFRQGLQTHADIMTWRHAAIAISRRHMCERGFKRDYGGKMNENILDAQAGHTTAIAGQIYARSIHEAPGHVASAKAEYRDISRKWHACIGFGVYLGTRPVASEAMQTNKNKRSIDQAEEPPSTVQLVNLQSAMLGEENDWTKDNLESWVKQQMKLRQLQKRPTKRRKIA